MWLIRMVCCQELATPPPESLSRVRGKVRQQLQTISPEIKAGLIEDREDRWGIVKRRKEKGIQDASVVRELVEYEHEGSRRSSETMASYKARVCRCTKSNEIIVAAR